MVGLPYLEYLELAIDDNAGLRQLLSIIEPSANDLIVTLTLSHSLDLKCSHEIRAFFERANVISLSLYNLSANHAAQILTCLDSPPCLQELFLSCVGDSGSPSLGALLVTGDDGEALARFPNLQGLAISDMSIDQAQLKRIIGIYHLRYIILRREVIFQAGPKSSMNGKDFLNWLGKRVETAISYEIEEEEEEEGEEEEEED
ncbi:hypothetical protein FRC12_017373 [Ceratobasidium sp. 428]|nr:hypothetical protein FRC12_017373 [Ceratobasidium sp. 428]